MVAPLYSTDEMTVDSDIYKVIFRRFKGPLEKKYDLWSFGIAKALESGQCALC